MSQALAALRSAAAALPLRKHEMRMAVSRGLRLLRSPTLSQLRPSGGPSSLNRWPGAQRHPWSPALVCLSSNGSSRAYSHNRQVKQLGDSYVVTFREGERDKTAASAEQQEGLLSKLFSLSSSDRKKVFCEFITQAVFNFCSCSAVAAATINGGGNPLLTTGLVMAAHMVLLPLLIFTFGPVSGAHFNPMVTATFMATKAMALKTGIAYIVAQTLGGVVGAAATFSSLPAALQSAAYAGINAVPADYTVLQAFMGEMYASFIFVSVLFGTVVDKRGWGRLGPIAVGLIVPLLMWLEGSVSSMCINPARAFGPALVTGVWDNHWIFWTAPFLGGVPAGLIYSKLFTQQALDRGQGMNGQRVRAPSLYLQEWLNGSPDQIKAGSHLVLNFVRDPVGSKGGLINEMEALDRAFPDISFLGVWSGDRSLLHNIVSATKPTYSIALDSASETAERYGAGAHESVVISPSGHIAWRGVPSKLKQALEQILNNRAASEELQPAKAA